MGGIKIDFREIDCEDDRWVELTQDSVHWRSLMLATSNLCVMLPQCWLYNAVGVLYYPERRTTHLLV
jgi:hypothetical protein